MARGWSAAMRKTTTKTCVFEIIRNAGLSCMQVSGHDVGGIVSAAIGVEDDDGSDASEEEKSPELVCTL